MKARAHDSLSPAVSAILLFEGLKALGAYVHHALALKFSESGLRHDFGQPRSGKVDWKLGGDPSRTGAHDQYAVGKENRASSMS
jgi:hypothetical protein